MLMQHSNSTDRRAFTLIELLVVVAVITVLGALFLPGAGKAKGKSMSMSAQCLNNQKQLIPAAIMYADDNQDWWMPNMPGYIPVWCAGTMNFNAGNTDNTNAALVMNASQSAIAPFIANARVVHCPADRTSVPGQGTRVRSVSMSGSVGSSPISLCNQPVPCPVNGEWLSGSDIGTACQPTWRTYGKS